MGGGVRCGKDMVGLTKVSVFSHRQNSSANTEGWGREKRHFTQPRGWPGLLTLRETAPRRPAVKRGAPPNSSYLSRPTSDATQRADNFSQEYSYSFKMIFPIDSLTPQIA